MKRTDRVDSHFDYCTMKSLFLFAICLLTLTGCSRDGNNIVPSGVFQSYLPQRDWVVNFLQVNGNDRVYQFSGYRFQFVRDGLVNAIKGSETIPGNWGSVTSGNKSILYFDYGSTQVFSQLNGSWEAVEILSDQVRLERLAGSSGGKDYLTLYWY